MKARWGGEGRHERQLGAREGQMNARLGRGKGSKGAIGQVGGKAKAVGPCVMAGRAAAGVAQKGCSHWIGEWRPGVRNRRPGSGPEH